jgi:TonB-linked SusC/RagA family outer membrane protein
MKKMLPPPRQLLLPALVCCLPLVVAAVAPTMAAAAPAVSVSQPVQVISGRVTDEKGQGLPGVSILVVGTTTGTSTNSEGQFTLDVPTGSVLAFSYVGYVTQNVTVGQDATINVQLLEDMQKLNEVVVVGYLTQKREDVTGSVATVSAVDVKRAPVATLGEAIQGRVPGVTVSSSGSPGQASVINIRGLGTLGGNSQPLYVVDGLWLENLRDFNPQDAESVQVLKDAASLAPYGSRGANGVIVITTKRGKVGAPAITMNVYGGVQNIAKRYDLTNAAQWAAITNQAYDNSGETRQPYANALPPGIDTDWQKEFFKQGSVQSYDLGVSGGGTADNGNTSNYNISGGYFKQNGTVVGPKFERYSARVNSGFNSGKLRVGESLLLTHTNQTRVNGLPFIDIVRMLPVTPVYDSTQIGGYGLSTPNAVSYGTNPVGAQKIFSNTGTSNRVQGSVFGEYTILPWLRYRLNLAMEYHGYHDQEKRQYGLLRYSGDNTTDARSYYAENQGNELFGMAENTLTFDKSFGDHNVTAVAGYSQQRFRSEFTRGLNSQYGTGPIYYWSLDAGTENPQVNGSIYTNTRRSFFGQLTYDYDQRYLFTAAYRNDASSRFAPGRRNGNFGAASVGWRISREKFFEGVTAISDLKLRASYGQLGNEQIGGDYGGSYRYQGFINPNVNYPFGGAQNTVNGAIQTNFASQNITWETRRTTNIGFDMGLLENRLTFGADYYIANTTDALIDPAIAALYGNTGRNPYQPIGEIRNKGFDFLLGYNENRTAFKYGINANLSTVKNEVISLGTTGDQANFFNAGPSGVTRTETGYEIGSFYLLQFDGIYQTGDANIPAGLQPGDVRYKDVDGDGVIDYDKDRAHVGRVFPKFNYGLNLTASYANFDLAAFFQGIQGNDVFNNTKYWLERVDQIGNYTTDFQPWTPENNSTTTPRAVVTGNSAVNNAKINSTRWLEDGSYMRLKNVQIGYTLPASITDRLKGITRFRIYASGQNVFTITDYSGYDPETVGGVVGNLVRGLDEGSYPNVRTFTLGVQIGL